MEWYVMLYSHAQDKIVSWNIFNNVKFERGVKDLLENYIDFDNFVQELTQEVKYNFWSRVEYEILVQGIHSRADAEKWDVSMQVLPNIKQLARHIIDYHNDNL